jgi:hypothetical protein
MRALPVACLWLDILQHFAPFFFAVRFAAMRTVAPQVSAFFAEGRIAVLLTAVFTNPHNFPFSNDSESLLSYDQIMNQRREYLKLVQIHFNAGCDRDLALSLEIFAM